MKKYLIALGSFFALAICAQIVLAAPYPTGLGGLGTSQTPASGTIPIGNGAGSYTPALLAPGSDITITNASGSVTIAVQGNQFLPSSTVYVTTVNGQSGVVTITSSTLGVATNTLSLFNGNGFTTTTIQSVLNSLSASGLLTYSSTTGAFGFSSSTLNLGTASTHPASDFLASSTNLAPSTTIPTNNNQLTNGSGFITTSTNLTPANFATTSVSQFPNDAGYIKTSSTANITASSVQANVYATGEPVFDVRAFGAKCDGVTNDTTAFQNAITAAHATNGTVGVPYAVCLISQNILSLYSNMAFVGVGNGPSELLLATNTAPSWGLNADTLTNVTVANLFISDKNDSPAGTNITTNHAGIRLNNDSNINIQNVRCEQVEWCLYGFNISSSTFSSIADFTGVIATSTPANSEDLFNIDELSDSTISNSTAYSSDTCFRLSGARRVIVIGSTCVYGSLELGNEGGYVDTVNVVGNKFVTTGGGGAINLLAFGNATSNTQLVQGLFVAQNNVNIVGNTFSALPAHSYTALGAYSNGTASTSDANINFSDNLVNASGATTGNGVQGMISGGTALNWTISNNQIENTPNAGVSLVSCVDCTVQGNAINNFNTNQGSNSGGAVIPAVPAGSGIRIEGTSQATSSNVLVQGNFINGNGNGGQIGVNTAGHGIWTGTAAYLNNINLVNNQIINVPNGLIVASDTIPASSSVSNWYQGQLSIGSSATSTFQTYFGSTVGIAGTSTFMGAISSTYTNAYAWWNNAGLLMTTSTPSGGSSSGGVGTSTAGAYALGNIVFSVGSSTVSASSGLYETSSTGALNFVLTNASGSQTYSASNDSSGFLEINETGTTPGNGTTQPYNIIEQNCPNNTNTGNNAECTISQSMTWPDGSRTFTDWTTEDYPPYNGSGWYETASGGSSASSSFLFPFSLNMTNNGVHHSNLFTMTPVNATGTWNGVTFALNGNSTVTGNLVENSSGSSYLTSQRGDTSHYATISLGTAGTDEWDWQMNPAGGNGMILVDPNNGGNILQAIQNGTTTIGVSGSGKSIVLGVATVASTSLTVNGTTTLASTTTIGTGALTFQIFTNGHIDSTGTTPTVSSCGTTPNGSATGTDSGGTIIVGGSASGCTLTFANAYASIPACVVTNQSMSITNAMTYTVSTAAIVISQTGLSNDKLDYFCLGND